ncbi:hypothetical protein [Mycobacterium europaeum]|uniref:hypothetical protein n=1 Tax=Mycobacterium europaeum TaxID=761804 RepID=UPI00114683A6|nr:hypothetical protein [Mycobacterium europaeum]
MRQLSGIPAITDVSAEEYLAYAKTDFSLGTRHGLINAMGNAKRCLHVMIDTLLQNYGLLVNNSRLPFPQKLALLDDVGLIGLNVFRKLNVERNIVEHEYRSAEPQKVEDFIDVCDLLLLAIERLGQDLPYQSIVGLRETGEHVLMELEPMLGRLDFAPLIEPKVLSTEAFGIPISYVSTLMRQGNREPEARSVGEVQHSIDLRRQTSPEWAPMIREIVSIGKRQSESRVTKIHNNVMTVQSSYSVQVTEELAMELYDFFGDTMPRFTPDVSE